MNGSWTNASTEKYLIPWFWDADGEALADDDQKLYHWNRSGGETTWELPAEWSDAATVKVYKLTDTGRTEEQEIVQKQKFRMLSTRAKKQSARLKR